MRIVSDFKDYYDGIQHYYKDDLVYPRRKWSRVYDSCKGEVAPFNSQLQFYVPGQGRLFGSSCLLGFCGKVYLGLELNYRTKHVYGIDDLEKYLKEKLTVKELVHYERGKYPKNYDRRPIVLASLYTRKAVNRYFSTETLNRNELFEVAPIWFCSTSLEGKQSVIFNPCLRSLEFFRVLDANQTYQELYMWFSNKAMPEKTIPKVSDEDMLLAKGFDPKFSFRKDKRNV